MGYEKLGYSYFSLKSKSKLNSLQLNCYNGSHSFPFRLRSPTFSNQTYALIIVKILFFNHWLSLIDQFWYLSPQAELFTRHGYQSQAMSRPFKLYTGPWSQAFLRADHDLYVSDSSLKIQVLCRVKAHKNGVYVMQGPQRPRSRPCFKRG